jgi:hypothetical protein
MNSSIVTVPPVRTNEGPHDLEERTQLDALVTEACPYDGTFAEHGQDATVIQHFLV